MSDEYQPIRQSKRSKKAKALSIEDPRKMSSEDSSDPQVRIRQRKSVPSKAVAKTFTVGASAC